MRVRWSPRAARELVAILDYLHERSPEGAAKVSERIQQAVGILSLFPHDGRATRDPAIRRKATPPFPYVVFYEVAADEVIIRHIRRAARKPESRA